VTGLFAWLAFGVASAACCAVAAFRAHAERDEIEQHRQRALAETSHELSAQERIAAWNRGEGPTGKPPSTWGTCVDLFTQRGQDEIRDDFAADSRIARHNRVRGPLLKPIGRRD
jgi:hypothetical protein